MELLFTILIVMPMNRYAIIMILNTDVINADVFFHISRINSDNIFFLQ